MGDMHSVDEHKDSPRVDRRERAIGAALLIAGLLLAGGALLKLNHERVMTAQADRQQQAQLEPDQTRPTTPAPQPAQPQVQPGVTTGAAPPVQQDRPPQTGQPLPQAPAEKMAPSMNQPPINQPSADQK